MRRFAIVAALAAAGCASGPPGGIPSPAEASAALNARYAGKPVQNVLSAYGLPQGQFQAPGSVRVFLWHATSTRRYHEPVTATTTGQVGIGNGAFAWAHPVPYTQTTTTMQGYNVEYACTLQVGVRPDGTVDGVGLQGKMGACTQFL